MEVVEAVKKGADLLDRYYGSPEWRDKIDPDRLDMGAIQYGRCGCVIAQLSPDRNYFGGLLIQLREFEEFDSIEYGFDNDRFRTKYQWDDLTEAWLEELTKERT